MKLARLLLLLTSLVAVAAADAPDLAARYGEPTRALFEAAVADTTAYDRLGVLCDRFGHRLTGSPQLEAAIDWAAAQMTEDGFVVRTQPVEVKRWTRGAERATLLAPVQRELSMIGLGMTPPTPEGGVEAEVVVVSSFDELDALGEAGVRGRIVLFDVPFTTYGETVRYRGAGPVRAAALGAVGALVRSVTPVSLDTPHTGATRVNDDEPTVPSAALSIEDASALHRMVDRGETVRVRLELNSTLEAGTSRNLIAELPGRERPDEVVVLGCHIDSWDLGQGAQDDGAGCLTVWDAARLIKASGLEPRRTLRVVFFTNEENGLAGGRTYRATEDPARHVAVVEADTGSGRSDGFRVDLEGVPEAARLRHQGRVWALNDLLAPLGATDWTAGHAGADIGPMVEAGVPGFGLRNDLTGYWPVHHTRADTFDKVRVDELQHNVGLVAALAWVLADWEGWGEVSQPPRSRRAGAGSRR